MDHEEKSPNTEITVTTPNVVELTKLVNSDRFIKGFVDVRTQRHREELSTMETNAGRQAEIKVGQSIPLEVGKRLQIDPANIKKIRDIRRANPPQHVEGMSDDEADELLKSWAATSADVAKDFGQKKQELVDEEKKRLLAALHETEDWEQAQHKLKKATEEQMSLVQTLRTEIQDRANDPKLIHALDVWGRSPDSTGGIGTDGRGYNAGVIHYFEYRTSPEKNGRYKNRSEFGLDHFIQYSEKLEGLIDNPDPNTNLNSDGQPNLITSAALADDEGQRRLYLLTTWQDKIVAFAKAGETKPKIVTVVPGGNTAEISKAVNAELSGQDKARLNKLGTNPHIVSIDKLILSGN